MKRFCNKYGCYTVKIDDIIWFKDDIEGFGIVKNIFISENKVKVKVNQEDKIIDLENCWLKPV